MNEMQKKHGRQNPWEIYYSPYGTIMYPATASASAGYIGQYGHYAPDVYMGPPGNVYTSNTDNALLAAVCGAASTITGGSNT